MKFLLHPAYFPNIATFATLVQHEVIWEMEDNYQKQTFRNRCYIATDQGRYMLNIPIRHAGGSQGRQKYKDVKVENRYHWQRDHWRTLETAYRTSPFFEFYEDDIAPVFEQKSGFLLDFNLKALETICSCLQLEMPKLQTSFFERQPKSVTDARFLIDAKTTLPLGQETYVQVFGDRHGFLKNLSILDLLFNEGTNALSYLQKLRSDFLNA